MEDTKPKTRYGKKLIFMFFHVFQEWGTCLELKEEDLIDRCDEMKGKP